MPIDRTTSLFFDATCLYAAAHSPTGGSARLLRLCRSGWFVGWASQPVLVEAERAIRRKGTATTLVVYEQLLRLAILEYAPVPVDPANHYHDVNQKDAHVYAAARTCNAHFLITLDKRLLDEINGLSGDPTAITPGDFLQQVLPTHPEYAVDSTAGQRDGGNDTGL